MIGTEYSPYKAFRHLDSLRSNRPVLCYWLITHRCNYNCPVCINKHMPLFNQSDELPLDVAKDYALQMKDLGVKALSISGGEPMLHRDFNKLITFLLDNDFEIGMISNGSLLDRVDVNLLAEFVWLRLSINSMSLDTFSAVHGTNVSRLIWSKVASFTEAIKKKGCVLGSSFLVQNRNMDEIAIFAEWSRDAGFDTCRYSYVRKPSGLMEHYNQSSIQREMVTAKTFEDDTFKVFTLSDRLELTRKKNFKHCYCGDLTLTITANTGLYRCCSLQNTYKGLIGYLSEKSLQELWNNRGEQDIRGCPMCWWDKKNEFIEYIVDDNPLHVNFV